MSASDYPDHLNPFSEGETKKSGLHIGHSFKEFRKTLRQSFRTKKKGKEDVQLRKHDPYSRDAVSYDGYKPPIILNYENVCTPALPRSRFKERLAMSYCPSIHGGPANPFEERSQVNNEVKVRAPRRKKRAPLPPKSSSSQSINEEEPFYDKNDSKWSLTSVETASTENMSDLACSRDLDISSELQTFTKEMEKLNDDDETEVNKVDSSEETKDSNSRINIPDVVVSCVDDDLHHDDEGVSQDVPIKDENEQITVSTEDSCERDEKAGGDEKNETVKDNLKDETLEQNDVNTQICENEAYEGIESTNGVLKEDNKKLDETSGSSNESLIIVDITQNLKNIEEAERISIDDKSEEIDNETKQIEETKDTHEVTNNVEKTNEDATEEGDVVANTQCDEIPLSFNERKSIYINGSRDELNNKSDIYSEKVSMYITGSQDNLDEDNNNELIHNKNITTSPIPTPKQRKAKLTKDDLLLGHNNCD